MDDGCNGEAGSPGVQRCVVAMLTNPPMCNAASRG